VLCECDHGVVRVVSDGGGRGVRLRARRPPALPPPLRPLQAAQHRQGQSTKPPSSFFTPSTISLQMQIQAARESKIQFCCKSTS
jgi:hypothetical protein